MKFSKFFVFVGALFLMAQASYLVTGIVAGTDVIVSPQLAGRMIRLTVDEGSEVHKGDLIAELDPAEYIAAGDSAEANIHALEAKVNSARDTQSWTDDQPSAVHALKALLLNDAGSQAIYSDVLILAGFSVVLVGLSVAFFRRQI